MIVVQENKLAKLLQTYRQTNNRQKKANLKVFMPMVRPYNRLK